MTMEQWLKCNLCFSGLDKSEKSSPFWLTSCGHVFCKKCLDSGGKQCAYCKDTNIASMPLTDSVKPEVKYIFKPLDDDFEKLRVAFTFQSTQSRIVLDRLIHIEQKYNFMREDYLQILGENKLLREKLKTTNENLEKFKNCFIASALQGSIPGTSPVSTVDLESKEANRHFVFYTTSNPIKFQTQVQKNELVTQTPANQRLQTLKVAPAKVKKQKMKKRIG